MNSYIVPSKLLANNNKAIKLEKYLAKRKTDNVKNIDQLIENVGYKYPMKLIRKCESTYDCTGTVQWCKHCGIEYAYSRDKNCVLRLTRDRKNGLSDEEHQYFVEWHNFAYNEYTKLWNKRFTAEEYTTKQMKEMFNNRNATLH